MKRSSGEDRSAREMRRLPSSIYRRLAQRQSTGGDHPDVELLAAFAEASLSRGEREAVLNHLASCRDCRRVLALMTGTDATHEVGSQAVQNDRAKWWGWRLAATAAAVLIVTGVAWQLLLMQRSNSRLPVISATVAPAPQVAVSAPTTAAPVEIRAAAPAPVGIKREPAKKPRPTIRAKQIAPQANSTEVDVIASGRAAAGTAEPAGVNAETLRRNAFAPHAGLSFKSIAPMRAFLRSPGVDGEMMWSLGTVPGGGALMRSTDGGKTWVAVPVDGVTQFDALSGTGPDVWVGGADGKLFHSADGGGHWTEIAVNYEGSRLAERITGIDARDGLITVKTASGSTLISADDGMHWSRK